MNKKIHRGVTILEVLAAVTILMLVSIYGADRYREYLQEQTYQVAAKQISAFNTAAKRYISDNTDSILTGTLPLRLTPTILMNKGYLESGFSNSAFDQSYVTGIVKNPKQNDKLQALTCSTGGIIIPFGGLRSISSQIDGMGGYIETNNIATGAFGGWTKNTADFGLSCNEGHIAISLSSEILGSSLQESDRLYRFNVNSRPDLNQMHTAIDMNSNNLNKVGVLQADKGAFSSNVTASGDIKSSQGWVLTQNEKGWLNETHGGGFTMLDNNWVSSINNKGISTGGQMKAGALRANGNVSAGGVLELDQVNVAGTSCPKNGNVSRDALGATLSCQSGVWRSIAPTQVVTFFKGTWPNNLNMGKQTFCSISKIKGSLGAGWDSMECTLSKDDQGNWFLAQKSGIGFVYCDAVCFK